MIIDKLEIISIKGLALKDQAYFERRVCRYYSEKFHTPLAEVYKLPWPFVFTNYLEHLVETNNTPDDIRELALESCYPEKAGKVHSHLGEFDSEEEEMQAWIRQIEDEEENKRNAKSIKEAEQNPHIEEETLTMDASQFEHLEKEMEEDV